MQDVEIILASASPRRSSLLGELGLNPTIRPADIDETPRPGEVALDLVERLAREKVTAVEAPAAALVIAADTIVVLDGRILGKPLDGVEARDYLTLLAGRSHDVATGVALRRGNEIRSAVEVTSVEMVEMSQAQIEWYVSTGEYTDKAGGYAMQGIAGAFVKRISGSFDNVIGLPRNRLLHMAAEFEIDLLQHR